MQSQARLTISLLFLDYLQLISIYNKINKFEVTRLSLLFLFEIGCHVGEHS